MLPNRSFFGQTTAERQESQIKLETTQRVSEQMQRREELIQTADRTDEEDRELNNLGRILSGNTRIVAAKDEIWSLVASGADMTDDQMNAAINLRILPGPSQLRQQFDDYRAIIKTVNPELSSSEVNRRASDAMTKRGQGGSRELNITPMQEWAYPRAAILNVWNRGTDDQKKIWKFLFPFTVDDEGKVTGIKSVLNSALLPAGTGHWWGTERYGVTEEEIRLGEIEFYTKYVAALDYMGLNKEQKFHILQQAPPKVPGNEDWLYKFSMSGTVGPLDPLPGGGAPLTAEPRQEYIVKVTDKNGDVETGTAFLTEAQAAEQRAMGRKVTPVGSADEPQGRGVWLVDKEGNKVVQATIPFPKDIVEKIRRGELRAMPANSVGESQRAQ